MRNLAVVLTLAFCRSAQICAGAEIPVGSTGEQDRHFTAREVFDYGQKLIFLAAFGNEDLAATNKVIYVTDVMVGGEDAWFEDVAPASDRKN